MEMTLKTSCNYSQDYSNPTMWSSFDANFENKFYENNNNTYGLWYKPRYNDDKLSPTFLLCLRIPDFSFYDEKKSKDFSSKKTSEVLTEIVEKLGLSVSAFAELMSVTRPTAYAYLKGTHEPGKKDVRITNMVRLIQEMEDAGIKFPAGKILYLRDSTGKTLKDKLVSEEASEFSVFISKYFEFQNERKERIKSLCGKSSHSIETYSVYGRVIMEDK